MRYTILLSAIMALAGARVATAQTQSKLALAHATVFLNCAMLENTATVKLEKGENEVAFTNLPLALDLQNVIITATNGVAVESNSFTQNYQDANSKSAVVPSFEKEVKALEAKKKPLESKIEVLDGQLQLLEVDNHDNLSVAERSKMIDLIGNRKGALLAEKSKLEGMIAAITGHIDSLHQVVADALPQRVLHGGKLIVKFYAQQATTSEVNIKYIDNNAGWAPSYDVWAKDSKSAVRLSYKAEIRQNTGLKWDKVRLTLSTGNPQESFQAPVLTPNNISLGSNQPIVQQVTTYNETNRQYKEVTVKAYKKPLIDPYKNNTILTAAEIKTKPTNNTTDLVALSPGIYQSKRGADVSADGGRTTGSLYVIDGAAVNNSGVHTSFDIDLPYSIESGNTAQIVPIKEYNIDASFRYYATPKLDNDAFLQAEISSWDELDLLSGRTNIFYEGTYIGKGYIDPRTIKDTLLLSVGRDKKVLLKRERDKRVHNSKMIGANETETFGFTITVRNTRKETVNIVLNDQLPVSNDKDIQLQDLNLAGASHDEVTGTLAWDMELKPNETKKVHVTYTLKYPKGKELLSMRL